MYATHWIGSRGAPVTSPQWVQEPLLDEANRSKPSFYPRSTLELRALVLPWSLGPYGKFNSDFNG